jgi:zinc protease
MTARNLRWSLALVVVALSAGTAMGSPAIQTHTLANGLEVYVVENHGAPLVTIELAIKGGAMVETPSLSGVSHFHEHMFTRSNQVLSNPEAFQTRRRELGIDLNGYASAERVAFQLTTTTKHRSEAMRFLRDSVLSPKLDQEDLVRERGVVLGELDQDESDPMKILFDRVDRRLWWKHPNRKNTIGDRQSILATTPAKLRQVQRRYYVPNNALMVVTGDVRAPAIFAEVGELYGHWRRGADPFPRFPPVTHPPLRGTEVVVIPHAVRNVKILMAWHGPSAGGATVEDSYPAQLLRFLLQAPWSKFQNNLVYSTGTCMGVGFGWQAERNVGPLNLRADSTPDKARTCVKAVLAELHRASSPDYFTDQELQLAVRRFELNAALERERSRDMADELSRWWALAGLEYYRSRISRVAAVTREDLARCLDRYVLGKPFVLGAMLSVETIAGGLDQRYFEDALGLHGGGGPTRSP